MTICIVCGEFAGSAKCMARCREIICDSIKAKTKAKRMQEYAPEMWKLLQEYAELPCSNRIEVICAPRNEDFGIKDCFTLNLRVDKRCTGCRNRALIAKIEEE